MVYMLVGRRSLSGDTIMPLPVIAIKAAKGHEIPYKLTDTDG